VILSERFKETFWIMNGAGASFKYSRSKQTARLSFDGLFVSITYWVITFIKRG
jgi:hypothetical protein